MAILDAQTARPLEGGASFTLKNRIERAVWGLTWLLLAAWTPPPLFAWRRFLLCLFGARLGPGVRIYGSVKIWYPRNLEMARNSCLGPRVICYNQDQITIGPYAIVSQGSHLCTGSHDISDPNFQLITKPIVIHERAWIAAEAFIGPGITVGEGAVVGARTVLFKDALPWTVYFGNPAKMGKNRILRS